MTGQGSLSFALSNKALPHHSQDASHHPERPFLPLSLSSLGPCNWKYEGKGESPHSQSISPGSTSNLCSTSLPSHRVSGQEFKSEF
jgi:hypothetical protein